MPVLVFYTGVNVDKASYDRIKDDIGWEATPPAAALLHLAGFDAEDRAFEVTLWESQEAYETYRQDRMMPAVRRAGADLPEPNVVPLYTAAISDLAEPYMTLVPSASALGARAPA